MTDQATASGDLRSVMRGPFRVLAIGRLFDAIGGGLTLSLFVVYLAEVRGLPILTASLVLTWMAVIGLAATPLVGTLTDRLGPRPVLLVAILVEAAGIALMGAVTTATSAFAVATVIAIGGSGIWGPQSTLIARVVPEEQHSAAFAINFMILNLGLGLGGLIGASIVDIARPETFELLYRLDALTYLASWAAIAALRGRGRPAPRPAAEAGASDPGGWRVVISDTRLRQLVLVSLALVVCGYGSMEAGLAIFITDTAGLTESLIGIVFLANTLTIVVSQLVVLKWLKGRSRTRLIGLVGVLWGVSWLVMATATAIPHSLALAVPIVATTIFALGEVVWSPTVPSLVNAIAPDHVRGRYNSAQSLTWSFGSMVAPVISGALIGAGQGVLWAILIGACCLAAAAWSQTLRRQLTADEDRA